MRKRLVYRADDVGYTLVFDLGIYKAFEEGIATSADVMLDSKHTVEALKWLKERPWISIGWHRHLWGWPVAGAENVPSMVNEEGKFKWRFDQKLQNEATYEDAYREFEAQLKLCKDVYGKYPDSAYCKMDPDNALEKAYKDILEKYEIPHNFWIDSLTKPVLSEYAHLGFKQWGFESFGKVEKHERFHLAHYQEYDPEGRILSVQWTNENEIWRVGGHPGFLDDYIESESTCNIHRIKEYKACVSPRVKQWIVDNKIELINQRDVLFGTDEYQTHLKAINSPLWIGNF